MDDDFGREVGRALRNLRQQQGLTLRELARLSGGRFTATGVAGYERGERSISLARFCDLVQLYGAAPDRVLRDLFRARPGWEDEVDLPVPDDLPREQARLIRTFVEDVLELRGEPPTDRISLREGDLEILAGSAGRPAWELMEVIRVAIQEHERRSGATRPPKGS